MSGFIDLHAHYLPGVDDGVRDREEAIELLRGLRSLGFERAIATPHMRSAYFENERLELIDAMKRFSESLHDEPGLPALGLGAEHHLDDRVFRRLLRGEGIPYPGAKAALIELPEAQLPLALDARFFDLQVRGIRPVIAHPERYLPFFRSSRALKPLLEKGAVAQLDLMSLVGKYGKNQKRAAERMLDEGLYFIACSDAHRPRHLPLIERGLEALHQRVGDETFRALLETNPASLIN